MKIATKRKIEIIVLILIVCMVSLGACGKGEEDYKKEIATLAEEQGLEDVEVSLEWIEETKRIEQLWKVRIFQDYHIQKWQIAE